MGSWDTVVVSVLLAQAIASTPFGNLSPGADAAPNESLGSQSSINQNYTYSNSGATSFNISASTNDNLTKSDSETPLRVYETTLDDVTYDYSGFQVWKITNQTAEVHRNLQYFTNNKLIAIWGQNDKFIDILVKPNAITNMTEEFKIANITYTIIIDDLQKKIDYEKTEEVPEPAAAASAGSEKNHQMTWTQYHRLTVIHGFMDSLAQDYPNIVTVETIGKTFFKRDVKALRISNGNPNNKKVFIDGGIHAREWISPATVTYFINEFATKFDRESEDVRNIDWYFVPVINSDGYEFTHTGDRLWRKNLQPAGFARNCIGTDLNRNWGYKWGGKGTSNNPCSDVYKGPKAFSELESQAVSNYIMRNGNFSAYLSYHSYGQYILYPWGYDNELPEDHEDLHSLGMEMAQRIRDTKRKGLAKSSEYSVGSSSKLLYPAAGGSDDWAKSQGIKYSYTIELSDTGQYGFILPPRFIIPVARESLAGLRAMAATVHEQ